MYRSVRTVRCGRTGLRHQAQTPRRPGEAIGTLIGGVLMDITSRQLIVGNWKMRGWDGLDNADEHGFPISERRIDLMGDSGHHLAEGGQFR